MNAPNFSSAISIRSVWHSGKLLDMELSVHKYYYHLLLLKMSFEMYYTYDWALYLRCL